MWYVRPAKPQISLRICAFGSEQLLVTSVKLLTEHHLEFLSLKEGCTDSSESTLVNMPHCWKSHVVAHLYKVKFFNILTINGNIYPNSSMVYILLFIETPQSTIQK